MSSKYKYERTEDGRRFIFGKKKKSEPKMYLTGYEARVFARIAAAPESEKKEEALDTLYEALKSRSVADYMNRLYDRANKKD